MRTPSETHRNHSRPEAGVAAPGVLLVGWAPASLRNLAELVHESLPHARIEMLSTTTELVFALARKDVAIVIIDIAHFEQAPPSLLSLLRGASSTLRLAFVGPRHASPHAISVDALPTWLQGSCAEATP